MFLRLTGRRVVVVGAGEVGRRKIDELLARQAVVRVVEPEPNDAVRQLAEREEIELRIRPFQATDLDEAFLAIASTNDSAANQAVSDAGEARHMFVNAVDDPPRASAFFASIVQRAPFVIAISSSGELPALSRLLREVLESALPPENWVARARSLRASWRSRAVPMGERFGELVADFVSKR